MNQSTLRYAGGLQAVGTVASTLPFEVLRFGDPLVIGLLVAAGAVVVAGSVESVAVGSFELSWRGWYAVGMCLLTGGVVATALGELGSSGSLGGAEESLLVVAQLAIASSVVVHAWLVVRRPETLDLTENVDRVVRLSQSASRKDA
ncbi:hypothetical protein [Halobaculum sp. MBLA0143]|uniref:hypothetical protein n=1 Tax=Halobaculum sp. MBLA0143 TaxID=3079933 RepID=UPI003524363A